MGQVLTPRMEVASPIAYVPPQVVQPSIEPPVIHAPNFGPDIVQDVGGASSRNPFGGIVPTSYYENDLRAEGEAPPTAAAVNPEPGTLVLWAGLAVSGLLGARGRHSR